MPLFWTDEQTSVRYYRFVGRSNVWIWFAILLAVAVKCTPNANSEKWAVHLWKIYNMWQWNVLRKRKWRVIWNLELGSAKRKHTKSANALKINNMINKRPHAYDDGG